MILTIWLLTLYGCMKMLLIMLNSHCCNDFKCFKIKQINGKYSILIPSYLTAFNRFSSFSKKNTQIVYLVCKNEENNTQSYLKCPYILINCSEVPDLCLKEQIKVFDTRYPYFKSVIPGVVLC